MIDVCRVAITIGDFSQERAQDVQWLGKKAYGVGLSVISITAELFKEVGGLRSVAGAVSAVVKGLDLFGVPVKHFDGAVKACESLNKGLGGVHVIQRLNEFATGKAFSSAYYLASRICFLVKDTLSFVDFMEGLSLISAGTSKNVFANISALIGQEVTSASISPTFEYVGWGLDTANNLALFSQDWERRGWDSLTWERGFSLALDATKLTAIGLKGSSNFYLKAIQLGALVGVSAVHIGRAIKRHVDANG